MKISKPLALVLALATALAVLSGSIAVPLLCRPFTMPTSTHSG